MYTLHTAYGRTHEGWHVIDNAVNETIASLNVQFTKVRLFVQWDGRDVQAVDMGQLWAGIPSYQWMDTLGVYLESMTNPTLPETHSTTLGEAPCMVYKDLFEHPVTVTTGNRGYSQGSAIPIGEDYDIVVEGKNGTVDYLADACLLSVNGRILPHMQVNDALYILNGRLALKGEVEATQTLGSFDLSPLGDWSYLPMDTLEVKVIEQSLTERIQGRIRVRVQLPYPTAGKHILPIVDGHPLWHRHSIEVLDDRHILLHLNTVTVAEYILRTPVHQRVGATAMNLRGTGVSIDRLGLEEYLSLTPSALVVVDNSDVCRHIEPLGRTDIPGRFSFHYPPKGMLILENDTMAEYSIEGWDGDQAAIGIANGLAFDYLHRQAFADQLPGASQTGRHPPYPKAIQGHMVNLYSLNPK